MLSRATPVLVPLVLSSALGCASIDFDAPKEASFACSEGATYLGRAAAELGSYEQAQSDFYPISDGIEALAARVLMAQRAEQCIDVQYYLIDADETAALFLDALLDAADRGVRVRLLLDDILTGGHDETLYCLDAHPNFEVRIFNPFADRTFRNLGSAFEVGRVTRRMHNKSFSVDGQITLIGGRNIGAEYFAARGSFNFVDLDVLCFGPIVDEVATMFDAYWNDRLAVPVAQFVSEPRSLEEKEAELRAGLAQARDDVRASPYGEVLEQTVAEVVEKEREALWRVPFDLVYDPPVKGTPGWEPGDDAIVASLAQALEAAEEEFLLITPYFVPQDEGIELFRELRERGVTVRVLTNSLASTNHSIVHTGYTPARLPLLDMGVELYELRPDAYQQDVERGHSGGEKSTLHTKAFVVDRERIFIGSFNWDPRSAFINTEMGVILDSPELARSWAEGVVAALPDQAFQVEFDDIKRLRWTTRVDGELVHLKSEPDTGLLSRFGVGLMGLLPIKSQL